MDYILSLKPYYVICSTFYLTRRLCRLTVDLSQPHLELFIISTRITVMESF